MSHPLVIVGRIRRAHGIRGEVVVEVMTESPDAIFAAGARVYAGDARGDVSKDRRELTVESARDTHNGLLVRFSQVADRTEAEKWRDRYVLVPAPEVEPPADAEVFIHDLVGLAVQRPDGSPVGRVGATYQTSAGLLLEIVTTTGASLLPYELEFIVSVDVPLGVMVIDPPDGLLS